MYKTTIGNCFDGHNKAYIYIWVSKVERIVYIGMTNSFNGTIGRAGNHFKQNGTLRMRFLERKGYYINTTEDFILLSFLLPQTTFFTSSEKSYREAVEYLVQKELQLIRTSFNPPFEIISWVRANQRTSNILIKQLASTIIQKFSQEYPQL